jgi:hypothetical protein
MTLAEQLTWLFVLGIPVACVAWTVTHEDVFAEPREYFVWKSEHSKTLLARKFFYLFTCEYCFSHYIAAAAVGLAGFRLLLPDWRGLVVAWFSVVWVANVYMSLFGRLRVDIKRERVETKVVEQAVEEAESAASAEKVKKFSPGPGSRGR